MNNIYDLLFILLIFIIFAVFFTLAYVFYYYIKGKLIDKLEYSREFSTDGVFEDEKVTIVETICNNSFLPIFFVDVESYIHGELILERNGRYDMREGMQLIISRFHLPPFTKTTRRRTAKCSRRGYYQMSSARVNIKNIFSAGAKYFEFSSELYVYPRVIEFNYSRSPISFLSGAAESARKVAYDPFSSSGIRNYASGDPFNLINFKASAKFGFMGGSGLKVNNPDFCSERNFLIYLNFQSSDDLTNSENYEKLMEESLSFATSLASEALKNGYKVGLSANCRLIDGGKHIFFPVAGGTHHVEEILKKLAKARLVSGVSFSALLESGVNNAIANTEIFLITSVPISGRAADHIESLKTRNSVTIINL